MGGDERESVLFLATADLHTQLNLTDTAHTPTEMLEDSAIKALGRALRQLQLF